LKPIFCPKYFSSGNVPNTKLFINGQMLESKANKWIDLHNPATNEVSTFMIVIKATVKAILCKLLLIGNKELSFKKYN